MGLEEKAMKDRSPATICCTSTPITASSCFSPADLLLSAARFVHKLCHTLEMADASASSSFTSTFAMESYSPAPLTFCRSSQFALERTITRASAGNDRMIALVTSLGTFHSDDANDRILAASSSASCPDVACASNSLACSTYRPQLGLAAFIMTPKGRAQPGGALKSAPPLAAILEISPAAADLAPHVSSDAFSHARTSETVRSAFDCRSTTAAASSSCPLSGLNSVRDTVTEPPTFTLSSTN
mmetsp:Transcript_1270/g.3904  ORF Transcript_1270/g.3904 Transcript_1270/m.3904 type:complete len:243 (+) Transcript_1270:1511-2239(+)